MCIKKGFRIIQTILCIEWLRGFELPTLDDSMEGEDEGLQIAQN